MATVQRRDNTGRYSSDGRRGKGDLVRPLGQTRESGAGGQWDPNRNKRRLGGSHFAINRKMGTQTQCRFCRKGEKYVDYKDIDTLQRLLTNRGKIYSRKRSGNCAACQRKVKKAIKRARYMALLPFTA